MDFSLDTLKIIIVATGITVFCHRNDCRWVLYVIAVIAAVWAKAVERVRAGKYDAPKTD